MKTRRVIIWTILVVAILLGETSTAQAGQPDARWAPVFQQEDSYVPNEVLVLLSADVDRNGVIEASETLAGIEAALRGTVIRRISLSRGQQVLRVKLPEGKSVRIALAENWRKKDRRIVKVEPNYFVHILATPNDPNFPDMWALNNTGQTGGTPDEYNYPH